MIPAASARTHQGGSPVTEAIAEFETLLKSPQFAGDIDRALETETGAKMQQLVQQNEGLAGITAIFFRRANWSYGQAWGQSKNPCIRLLQELSTQRVPFDCDPYSLTKEAVLNKLPQMLWRLSEHEGSAEQSLTIACDIVEQLSPDARAQAARDILGCDAPVEKQLLFRLLEQRESKLMAQVLRLVKYLPEEDRAKLLLPGPSGKNVLKLALGHPSSAGFLEALLAAFSPQEALDALELKFWDETLHDRIGCGPDKELRTRKVRALKPLLEVLGPEERAELLQLNCLDHMSLHVLIKKPGMVAAWLEILTDEEVEQLMRPDKEGWTLYLHLVYGDRLEDLKALDQRLSPELKRRALQPSCSGFTILNQAREACFPYLMETLSDTEFAALQIADSRGKHPLHELIIDLDVKQLEIFFQRMTPEQLEMAFVPCNRGNSPLHFLVMNRVRQTPEILALLEKVIDPAVLDKALLPNQDGETPFHQTLIGHRDTVVDLAKFLLRRGGPALTSALQPLGDGRNLFHLCQNGEPGIFELCLSLYEAAGKDPAADAVSLDINRRSPLWYASSNHNASGIESLIDIAGEKELARCLMQPDLEGITPIRASWMPAGRMAELFAKLLSHLPDTWSIGIALGSGLKQVKYCDPIMGFLMERVAVAQDPLDFLGPLLINQIYYKNDQDPTRGCKRDFPPEQWKRVSQFLKAVEAIFEPAINGVQAQRQQTRDEAQIAVLDRECKTLKMRQSLMEKALVVSGADSVDIAAYLPLLKRIQRDCNDDIFHKVCKLIARFPLKRTEGQPMINDWLGLAKQGTQPCIYLFVLNALECRGVSSETITALQQTLSSLSRKIHEGGSLGTQCLDALMSLVQDDLLNTAELENILVQLMNGDFIAKTFAMAQIIDMGKTEELQAALKNGPVSFSELAHACFRGLVPIEDIEDFSQRYQDRFGSQRSPSALLTYAAGLGAYPETRKDLGDWVSSVLKETDLDARYSCSQNPHLQTVYGAAPQLEKQLPKIVGAVPSKKVQELSGASNETSLPLNANEMRNKIGDKHIDIKRFTRIQRYVDATSHQDRIAIFKEFAADKRIILKALKSESPTGTVKGHDLASMDKKELSVLKHELQLEALLCKLSTLTDPLQFRPTIRSAITIGEKLKGLGQGLGSLLDQDLSDALQKAAGASFNKFGALTVAITDNYWDLFLIGTDVRGSCQSVTSAKTNHCLLGYVMDGKNLAVVVRGTDGESIAARRMLRVELDSETGTPVLFLERLYSNFGNKAIDDAIHEMAKAVATELNLPLYTIGGSVKLTALRGRAAWTYSDASVGRTQRGYTVSRAKLLFDPGDASCCAASSSS